LLKRKAAKPAAGRDARKHRAGYGFMDSYPEVLLILRRATKKTYFGYSFAIRPIFSFKALPDQQLGSTYFRGLCARQPARFPSE